MFLSLAARQLVVVAFDFYENTSFSSSGQFLARCATFELSVIFSLQKILDVDNFAFQLKETIKKVKTSLIARARNEVFYEGVIETVYEDCKIDRMYPSYDIGALRY